MNFHQTLSKLTTSTAFNTWHTEHKHHFLAHAFLLLDDANKDTWQFGFYNPETKKMTTWLVSKTLTHTQEQEILETGAPIQKLDPALVTIEPEKAIALAEDIRKKEHAKEIPIKHFFIIQMIDGAATYNITYFCQSFNTLNIKIHAKDGSIISSTIQKLMDFG
ncbi:hypothetical protein C4580_05555 [Candidatus Woesearchaeota archaeon]|nr:MAG: hypothetical protein C4580_05555 [Candidatus Woesearchaeota archaeon]